MSPKELVKIARKMLKLSPDDAQTVVGAFDAQDSNISPLTQENVLGTILMQWHENPSIPHGFEPRRALALKISEIGELLAKKASDNIRAAEIRSNYNKLAKETDQYFVKK